MSDDSQYPNLFKHWITTVYASGMPDVPDEFTRADMAKAFEAGCARYNDLLQSWSESRARHLAAEAQAETLGSALREEAQRSETYLAAYRSATDDLRKAQKLLDEARSREYHGDLQREAHGMKCVWPACAERPKCIQDHGACGPAIWFPVGKEYGYCALHSPVSQWVTLESSGEQSRANLAGPEGDARPEHNEDCILCSAEIPHDLWERVPEPLKESVPIDVLEAVLVDCLRYQKQYHGDILCDLRARGYGKNDD